MTSFPEDPNAKYRVRLGDDPQLVEGEIRILQRLTEAVDRRVGRDATPKERQAAFLVMVKEDAEMAELTQRLHEMSRCHSRSVVSGLLTLAEEDQEEEEEEKEDA